MNEALRNAARRADLIGMCPKEAADILLDQGSVRMFERGATVFSAGAPAQHVFVIMAGWVKLYSVSARGQEAVINVLGPGQTIGDAAVLGAPAHMVHAEATTRVQALQLPVSLVLSLMDRSPETRGAILAGARAHLNALVREIEMLKLRDGAQRAARFLLSLLPPGQGGACDVRLPYDKVVIAGRIGMSPESLSRAFARLRNRGVTVEGNTARIADTHDLSRFCDLCETE
ncbi:Crp/Fnr family transcriptional regulator [Ponticoccus litoralis]|uniref:Cyclic nucleotide-binding domain-containing protein n=1 Tax=Ponticoccus litoralis TaxID=422297 RepID=A0AAW9SSC3_9RHOB